MTVREVVAATPDLSQSAHTRRHRPSLRFRYILQARIGRLEGEPNVRFGSLADMCGAKRHVRFAPNSDREIGHRLLVQSSHRMQPPLGVKDACDRHSILSDVTEWTKLRMRILIRRSPSTSPQKNRSSGGVRFVSKADMYSARADVRFTRNRTSAAQLGMSLWASSGHSVVLSL